MIHVLSKTTYPQKLFPSDCITLYLHIRPDDDNIVVKQHLFNKSEILIDIHMIIQISIKKFVSI